MNSPFKNPVGITHVWHALRYARDGLQTAWQHEDAFRQEVLVSAVALPIVWFCPVDLTGKVLMVLCLLLVLIVELINSALEAAVDHTSLERHPLAKRAKDIASAAVLLSILNASLVWGVLLWHSI